MAKIVLQASAFRPLFPVPQHLIIHIPPNDVRAESSVLRVNYCSGTRFTCSRSLIYCSSTKAGRKPLLKPISAIGSGLEATVADPIENLVNIKNVEIVVESKDDDKMQVRVDVTGKETQILFDKSLRNLARTAPPVPGFRLEKGGKTSKIPKEFLLQILGEDHVNNFVIKEIVSSILADYVKKENLTVKDNKINTIQTAEELKSQFIPGNDFGFNAILELEKSTEESQSQLTAKE